MITVVNATFFGNEKPNLITLSDQPKYKNVKYIAFTNKPDLIKSETWDIIEISQYNNFRKKAREIKTNIHKFVDNTEYWLWIDNNCVLQSDPNTFLKYLNGCDLLTMPHPERNNIIEEANILLKWKKDQAQGIQEAINFYYKDGYIPMDLYETKILMRRNTEKIKIFNEMWWEQIQLYSIRDQISFPYISWKTKMFVNTFPGNNSQSQYRLKTKPYIPYWDQIVRI
jgi:hypothetical protein